ncbi:MAG: LysR family transcriptional regulator [Betaproteobacteria bacterium]|nr:LysR family transcriptional regulator [Betaproteobacteria bacterium]
MRWFTEMAVFAKVVELGSFSRAASALNLTRSAVSKHVARLEDGLGVKLLHRSTRAMSLTDAGRAVHEQCAVLANAADQAVAAASRLVAEPRGTLRISVSTAFGSHHVAPLLPEFLARYPELEIDLVLVDRHVDLAEEGFDVVLRLTDSPQPTLAARKLADLRFVLCAAPSYLAAHGKLNRIGQLSAHACVRQRLGEEVRAWRLQGPGGVVTPEISGNVLVSSGDAVRRLLLAGAGLGILPSYLVGGDLRAGRLIQVLPRYKPLGSFNALYALYLTTRQGNPKVRAFIDYMIEKIGTPPYWDAV